MTIKNFKTIIGIIIYHWIEDIDGEHSNFRLIEYKLAEKIKLFLLINLIEDEE